MKKLILLIVLFLLSATYAQAQTYGSNVLTGGTCSADTTFGGNVCGNALDGTPAGTPWTSGMSAPPHWWKYDLGSGVTKTVAKLTMYLYKSTAVAWNSVHTFKLQGSSDDSVWHDVYNDVTTTGADESTVEYAYTFTNTTSTYRYWRVYTTDSAQGSGFNEIYNITMHECTDCTGGVPTPKMQIVWWFDE